MRMPAYVCLFGHLQHNFHKNHNELCNNIGFFYKFSAFHSFGCSLWFLFLFTIELDVIFVSSKKTCYGFLFCFGFCLFLFCFFLFFLFKHFIFASLQCARLDERFYSKICVGSELCGSSIF